MTPLREMMIKEMTLAGFATTTKVSYVKAVRRLTAHYHRSPDELSEEEVRAYLIGLRDRLALGAFKVNHGAIRFLYRRTLSYDWQLFGEKKFVRPSGAVCPKFFPMQRLAQFCAV